MKTSKLGPDLKMNTGSNDRAVKLLKHYSWGQSHFCRNKTELLPNYEQTCPNKIPIITCGNSRYFGMIQWNYTLLKLDFSHLNIPF